MYRFSSRVRYSECDRDALLSHVALINYLQDCTTFHTESLGLGLDHMADHHFAWLIAAWQIEIVRRPRFKDPIVVSAWCHGMNSLLAHRNFTVTSPEGEVYVRADSLWFTYDTANQRICRIPESEYVYLEGDEPLDMPPTERKLKTEGPFTAGESIVVGKQHLDTNGHVNNAQYVLMAIDALPEAFEPSRIRVQYREQAHLHDVLVPRIRTTDMGFGVELASDDGHSFAAVLLDA